MRISIFFEIDGLCRIGHAHTIIFEYIFQPQIDLLLHIHILVVVRNAHVIHDFEGECGIIELFEMRPIKSRTNPI